jgi:hypothetical protein
MFIKPDVEVVRYAPGFRWPRRLILAVLALELSVTVFGQSTSAPAAVQNGSARSLPKLQPDTTPRSEPNPRPDWVPKGAVWTGNGWNAPLAPWDRYGMLFDESVRNDEAAAASEKRGADGSRYRDSLKKALGLTESQAQDLRQAAFRERKKVDAINQKINAVIKAYRASVPKDAPIGPERWKVAPPPKELDELEQEREETIMRIAEEFRQSLSPEAASMLEKRINAMGSSDLAPKVMSPEEVQRRREILKNDKMIMEEKCRKEQERQQQQQEVQQ